MSAAVLPQNSTSPHRRLPPVALLLLVWTGVGVFFGARSYVNALLFGMRFPGFSIMGTNLLDGYLWALLTGMVVFPAAASYRFTRRRWPLALAVHSVLAVALSLLVVMFDYKITMMVWPQRDVTFSDYFRSTFYLNVQWYVVIAGAFYALDYYRRFRDQEVHAARMNERLAQARLEALKMQIQPHFLFNTLHSISELLHEDADAADRMVTRLGDLLRITVDNASAHEVPLEQEMEFLRAYLDIQQTRFQDTLRVDVRVEPAARGALVPNLLLQPLVENAIKHGTAPRGGEGRIWVSAARSNGRLRLEVRDNGAGPAAQNGGGREGVGINNTRARLEQLYGTDHRFSLAGGPRGGAVATVEIPWRPAEVPASTKATASAESTADDGAGVPFREPVEAA